MSRKQFILSVITATVIMSTSTSLAARDINAEINSIRQYLREEIFPNISDAIDRANNSPELDHLTDRVAAFTQQVRRSEQEESELTELTKKLFNTKEYLEIKKSSMCQEALKFRIKVIKLDQALGDPRAQDEIKIFNSADHRQIYLSDVSQIKSLEELTPLQTSDSQVTDGILNANLINIRVVDNRINRLAGVSSGDTFSSYGIWVKGTYTTGQQKSFKFTPGYKFNQQGMTIGTDIGDDSLIGIAYSFFKNNIKNKINSVNKEKVDTYIGTIYGLYSINQSFFITGQGQFGHSKIKKTRDTGDLTRTIANGKTTGDIISGKLVAGYKYDTNYNVELTPVLGIAYHEVKVKGYTETGNGLNRTIGKRKVNRTSGIAGVTAKYNINIESMDVTPELHADIDYVFNSKNSDTNITLIEGIDPIVVPAEKLAKIRYNLGGSIQLSRCGQFEIAAGYDLGLSKKFISHTSSFKLKVNF